MSGLTDDWDAVPVTAGKQTAPPSSLTADWDAVPITAAKPSKAIDRASVAPASVPMATAPAGMVEQALHMGTGIAGQIAGGWAGLLTGNPDNVAKVQDALTYEPRTQAGRAIERNVGLGMDQAKNAILSVPGVGGLVDLYNTVADKAGAVSPAAGAAVRTLPAAVGMLAIPEVRGIVSDAIPLNRIGNAADVASRIEPTLAKPRFKLNTDGTVQPVAPAGSPAAPSASTAGASASPTFTAMPTLTDAGKLPPNVVAERNAILEKIGLDTKRPSAINGDAFTAGQEYQDAKMPNAKGEVLRTQFDKERNALQNYGDQIVANTGGTPGMLPEARGTAIVQPLQSLGQWFDGKVNDLYAQARQKAGELGTVEPTNLNALMQNPAFRDRMLSSADGTHLMAAIERQIARFSENSGGTAPNTVNGAENLRQFLNSISKPGNYDQIAPIKQALDMDVAAVGGENTFNEARQLYKLRKDTLDNPQGMASILNESGPDGINRAVALEKVPDKLLSMPNAQFRQIIDTLQTKMPPELQPQAQQAINEIKAHLAETIQQAGNKTQEWGAKHVTKTANALQGKLDAVMSPQEMDALKTLNDAGHILQKPTAYPGAHAQKENILSRAAGTGLPYVTGAAGGAVAGPVGAGIGAAAGNSMAKMVKGFTEAKAARELQRTMKK